MCVQSRKRETIFINQTLNKRYIFFMHLNSHIEHTVNMLFSEMMSSPCVYTKFIILMSKFQLLDLLKFQFLFIFLFFSVQNVGAFQVGLQKLMGEIENKSQ